MYIIIYYIKYVRIKAQQAASGRIYNSEIWLRKDAACLLFVFFFSLGFRKYYCPNEAKVDLILYYNTILICFSPFYSSTVENDKVLN